MRRFVLFAVLMLGAAPAMGQEAPIFRAINEDVLIPLNQMALTADGAAIDTGFVFNDAGVSFTAVCTPNGDGTGATTATAITLTTGGEYDIAHLAGAMYTVETPADGASFDNDSPQTCMFSLEADDILIARSPWVRFDVPCLQHGADVWFRGAVGADGLDTTHLDLSVNSVYPDDWPNGHSLGYYDSSTQICYSGISITDFVGSSSLATLDSTLPVTPVEGDLFFVRHTKTASIAEVTAGLALETTVDAVQNTADSIEAQVSDVDSNVDAILLDTGELQTDWVNGGRLDLILDATLLDTAEIGTAGAGLTAVPWNAAWDAEVESEVEDAVGADVTAVLADTNELQGDWVNGGRLDLILDARASQASVDTAQADLDIITGADGVVIETSNDGTQFSEAGGTGDHLTALPIGAIAPVDGSAFTYQFSMYHADTGALTDSLTVTCEIVVDGDMTPDACDNAVTEAGGGVYVHTLHATETTGATEITVILSATDMETLSLHWNVQ